MQSEVSVPNLYKSFLIKYQTNETFVSISSQVEQNISSRSVQSEFKVIIFRICTDPVFKQDPDIFHRLVMEMMEFAQKQL